MNNNKILLGVNIDHVATLRQARGTCYPDPLKAMYLAEKAGADGITIHLREDRRHIQDRDVELIAEAVQTRLNLEMAVTDEMVKFAEKIKPAHCCLVPEKRAELTTEGGLDVVSQLDKVTEATARLTQAGMEVSLFIDPDLRQIEAAHKAGAPVIEIHTGAYADVANPDDQQQELQRIIRSASFACELGLVVNAGHGLNFDNVKPIAAIPEMNELNIGHSLIAYAIFMGLEAAVAEMKRLMIEARK